MSWIEDLLGYKDIKDALGQLLPRRKTIKFVRGSVADNAVTGVTEVDPNSNQFYAAQAFWEISQATGNDSNDGTPGHPLATLREFLARLAPGGTPLRVNQLTTVNLLDGTFTEGLYLKTAGLFNIVFQGKFSSSAPITLVTVTNTVPGITTVGSGTRGRISRAAGNFVVNQMLRCVAGSHVGAVAYVQALDGDPQHAFVTHWHTQTLGFRATQVNLTAGDVVVVDTNLVNIPNIYVEQSGLAAVRFRNIGDPSIPAVNLYCGGDIFSVTFDLCQGGFSCSPRITGPVFMRCQGAWFCTGGYIAYQGGNHFINSYLYSNTRIDFSGGDCVTGSGFRFYGCTVQQVLDWAAASSPGGLQFEGVGECMRISQGTLVGNSFSLPMWGVTGSTANGIAFDPLSSFSTDGSAGSLPTMNAVVQVKANNKNFLYSQIPFASPDSGISASIANTYGPTFIPNVTVIPAVNTAGGVQLYSDAGVLKWRDPAGTVHILP